MAEAADRVYKLVLVLAGIHKGLRRQTSSRLAGQFAPGKPLPTQIRETRVYANGPLAKEPEFFGTSDSGYAYADLTGYVSVDSLDVIS